MSLFTRRKPDERDEVAAPYEPPAPVVREPATIGELLRSKRESFGVTLVDVGTTLRIRAAFLEAIEDDRYDRLPGAAYALGFVRTYADHLGLDGDAMARRYKSEVAGFQPKRDLAFPMPLSERSLPGGAVLLVALIIAACAYAVWYYRASGDRARPDRVAEVPAQVVPLPPPSEVPRPPSGDAPAGAADTAPASPTGPDASAPSTTPQPNQTPDTAPAAPPAAAPVAVAPQAAVPPAPVQAAAPPAIPEPPPATAASNAPRVFGPSSGPVRIVLKATTDSWIQVREPNQSVLSMRTLKAGDSYRVPDRPGLTLRTGNAGGLEVTVDGKPVPPVGPPGKSRTVALDPDKLAAGSAAAE